MSEHIAQPECIPRHLYQIHSRNLTFAVYDGNGGFIGIRQKFDSLYLFTEYHRDTGGHFGTVSPEKDLGPIPEGIPVGSHKTHEKGSDWAERDGVIVPSVRRDLREGEDPHFTRQGFVDEYADTGERLPKNVWPSYQENKPLFDYLYAYTHNGELPPPDL